MSPQILMRSRENYRPMQRLIEADLATRFSLGRPTIRDILRILEERGQVSRQCNRGAFVVDFSAKQIRDIYFVRCCLEEIAAKLAFDHLTDNDVNQMEKMQARLKASNKTDVEIIKTHEGFHEIIFRAADNETL